MKVQVHISKKFLGKMTWDLSHWKTVDILKVVPYILGCTALKITSTFPSVQCSLKTNQENEAEIEKNIFANMYKVYSKGQ